MTPLNWSIIVFLCGISLLGLPIGAESSTQENKPSSAKECRQHIEKALEQYWDKKNEPQDLTKNEEDDEITGLDDESRKQTPENTQDEEEDDNEIDEDDDDNEDDEENSNKNENADDENTEKENIDDEEDVEEDDDDDDEVSEQSKDENEHNEISDHTPKNDKDKEEDEDNDEEDEDDEEDGEIDTSETDDETSELFEENNTKDINKTNINQEEEDEEEDEEKPEQEEDQEEEDEEEEEEKQVEEEEQDEEEEQGEDEEQDEEEEQGKENDQEEEEGQEDEENKNKIEEENLNEGEKIKEIRKESEPSLDEIKIEIEIKNDKVTGEANRSSDSMATKFSDGKLSSHQSQTSEDEEKVMAQDDNDSEDDEIEDNDSGSDETNEKDDDSIENIYEEDDDADSTSGITYRSRDHIDAILGFDEIGTEYDKEEEKLAQSIYKEIKKIHLTHIKPVEMLYKYVDSTTRVLGDAEIFNQPMIIFLGPWSAGKTSIINYLLGIERTQAALKTGTGVTDVDFTLIRYGDQNRVRSGTELAADWRYAGLQKFGQGFLDHFRSIEMPHTLLKKITLVDTPGILENKKNAERGYSLSDAFQWFVDRSDAIYVVLDPTKVDIGGEVGSVIDQLKGRDPRFILNKADSIRRSDLMRVVGQLFWNLSPLMSSSEAPVIYALSLTTKPYHPSAPAKFLADQEKNFLYDMKDTLDKRVENRILYARRHAVRVRNHAKMIDCYLATYYRHKSIFSSKRNVANLIIENPRDYNIFDGLGDMKNVSRYDLPDPTAYKEFFKLHPLYDFKPLASTCSYFRGCPMEKLDLAISKSIPELLAKYTKMKSPRQGR